MRKGEEKRREMLAVAERLFCLKGYDATSIQDILDVLHISKGGFYHYFASKEALLESIFLTRAEHAAALAEASVVANAAPMDRLNGVLAFFMPLRKDDKAFMAMLLPLMERQEGQARACAISKPWKPPSGRCWSARLTPPAPPVFCNRPSRSLRL